MKKIILAFFWLFYLQSTSAQNWQRFAGDSTLNINGVYIDSSSSTLYANAYIVDVNGDTIHSPCIWNGINFNKIGDFNFSPYTGFPLAIIKYHNNIFIGGEFNKYRGAPGDYFLKLNANNGWDTASISPSQIVLSFGILDDTLIVMGRFSSVDTIWSQSVAKYANGIWTPLETGIFQLSIVRSMCSYNDSIIFSGNFSGDYSVPYDGSVLVYYRDSIFPFGRGIDIGSSLGSATEGIRCSVVYNGELYVAGDYISDDGRSISKWNGTNWVDITSTPGVVVPFSIRAMAVYNNELYVGGSFVYIGGVYASHVAKWDGYKWCGLGSYINGPVNTMFVYNNELTISGEFNSIDGVYFNSIAKWVGGNYSDTCQVVGVEELKDESNIVIYPTLVESIISINNSKGMIDEISVVDIVGRTLIKQFSQSHDCTLDFGQLKSGLYFVKIKFSGNEFIRKVVKM